MIVIVIIVLYDRTVITIVNYDHKTFIEQATVITIINYDRTVITIVNYNRIKFIVQAIERR